VTNEVQHLAVGNAKPNKGTFTLALDTVPSVPISSTPTDVELTAALEGMANIGTGNVFVSDFGGFDFDIEFIDVLGHQDVSLLVADGALLIGGVTVAVSPVTEGAPVPDPPPGGNTENFFPVTGYWVSVESADTTSTATNTLAVEPIAGLVTFYARLPKGASIPVAQLKWPDGITRDTGVILAPVSAQIVAGQLCTANADNTPGVQLVCNSAALALPGPLIYDVDFPKAVYNQGAQLLSPFAFEAPQDSTPVCLSDPGLARLEYLGPIPGGR
jgi:hypothetical protein